MPHVWCSCCKTQTAATPQDVNITSEVAFPFTTVFLIYGLGWKTPGFTQLCACWGQCLRCSISREVVIKLGGDIAITIEQDVTDSDKKFLQSAADILADVVTDQAVLAI